jgi:hypothetical protein
MIIKLLLRGWNILQEICKLQNTAVATNIVNQSEKDKDKATESDVLVTGTNTGTLLRFRLQQ